MSDNNAINVPPHKDFIFGIGLDQQTTRTFVINLQDWSKNNERQPLRVNVNSGGGNILDSLFLYEEFNRIRSAGHHLTMAVYGRAGSCAGWLLQAADRRIIGANSWILLHEVSSAVDGTLSEIRAELERCEELQHQTNAIITRRSKLTEAELMKLIDGGRNKWVNATKALEWGLVDEIEAETPFA
jgi:Protease subunit of ATP-dependent Clp proteases